MVVGKHLLGEVSRAQRGYGGMPWGGHKQEKMYFTATKQSKGEVRVGGQ